MLLGLDRGPGTVDSSENSESYLPLALRIRSSPLNSKHEPNSASDMSLMVQIPDMFHAQKECCFCAMGWDASLRLLRPKLAPVSALVRLV
ncbi:hypothetical protein FOMPIDRAFT_82285 [Fomitopsis schrenkii]|uniref:Uncharacterized protein n=1 Tax=Fomitopsis schrenkii TaxID=2126942 RepID=S8F3E5_FOMSC|nr:hypothetical protein FOMPIDRAFT_82285 [Fomitopsis schrenkii]